MIHTNKKPREYIRIIMGSIFVFLVLIILSVPDKSETYFYDFKIF